MYNCVISHDNWLKTALSSVTFQYLVQLIPQFHQKLSFLLEFDHFTTFSTFMKLRWNVDEMSANSVSLDKVGSHMIFGQNVPGIAYARGVRFWARCRSPHEHVLQHLKHFDSFSYACFDFWNCEKGVNSTQNRCKTWFMGSFLDGTAFPELKMAVSHRDRIEFYVVPKTSFSSVQAVLRDEIRWFCRFRGPFGLKHHLRLISAQ